MDMTVYVSDAFGPFNGKIWYHLVGTSADELDYFAVVKLDLKVAWRQRTGGYTHYDLRPAKRDEALRKGARYLPTRELLKRVKPDRRKTTQEGTA